MPLELFGDGTQSRDFTYVDDVARDTILAAKPLGYEIINLGGGRNPISLQTVIAFIPLRIAPVFPLEPTPALKTLRV